MQRIFALIASTGLLLGTAAAHGAGVGGDPAAGARKSQTCASCHGEDGRADNAQYPILAGQHASYLYRALKDYKTGARQNPVMNGLVSNLSEQDMRDLAAYYASREPGVYTVDLNATGE